MSKGKTGEMFLPPKSDVAFKELMRNEKVRRHFISDVLGIPLEEIREVRLENTFLGRRSRREKEGILDVRVLLNNDCRINIELQVREVPAWDKRSLFYLSKMYAEGAHAGEDYSPLKKCIVICVLGFKWDAGPVYHKVYYLKDQEGQLYSDQFEVHVIELDKELTGDRLDDWIRLFRVKNMGELKMMQSTNPGVMEAVREVMAMNMGRRLRALYEEHMRIKKDRLYLRNAAIQEGTEIGKKIGIEIGKEIGIEAGMEAGMKTGIETGIKTGIETGRKEGELNRSRQVIYDFLDRLGTIPEDIRMHIEAEQCEETLRTWYLAVPQVKDYDEFRKIIYSGDRS